MFKDRFSVRSVVVLLIFTLVVSAFGFVAAQDNSSAPFVGVGLTSANNGVRVDQVQPGSPADNAGVKVGDIITAIDTKAVTADTIRGVIAEHRVGDVITLSLMRGTTSMNVKVTLAERPAEATAEPSSPASANRPMLGIQLEDTANGPVIRAVVAGSPAEKAGLKVDDVLTKIGDTAVKDAASAGAAIQALKVGDEVSIEVMRAGQTVMVTATLAAAPATVTEPPAPITATRPMLGVQLQDTDKGVVIQSVAAGSPAETAGLKVGDVLTKINDTTIKDAASASAAVQALKVGDEVTVEITRDRKTMTVKATLAAAPMTTNPFQNGNGVGISYDGTSKQWLISSLPQDSDLYKAGLREGDKITKFDGTAYDPAALAQYLSKATDDVTLTVTRDGKDQEIKVPATALMSLAMGGFGMGELPFNLPFNMQGGGSRLGVEFVTLDPSVAKEHNVTETVGALVTQVMPQSPADKAGIKQNDVVTKVDGSEVNAEHTLRDLLATHKPGDNVKLDVMLDQMPMSSAFPFFNFGQGGSDGFPFQLPTPQPASPLDNGTAM
jgi:S1-C subfamily serine protease